MSISLLDTDLAHWDQNECETLVVTFFSDERPLRGAAGLADWRLCGRLSKYIKHRKITGMQYETLLLPPGRRLTFHRLLLIGLGASGDFNEDAYLAHVKRIRTIAHKAGVTSYATQPPGRATEHIGARRALDLWLEHTDQDEFNHQVVLIEGQNGQREMAEILRYRGGGSPR